MITTIPSRSFALATLLLTSAFQARPQSNPQPPAECIRIDLAARTKDANNASELVAKLAAFSDLKAQAMSDGVILLCGPNNQLAVVTTALQGLGKKKDSEPVSEPATAQHSVHLYYLRNAADVATAMSSVFSGITVKAIGN